MMSLTALLTRLVHKAGKGGVARSRQVCGSTDYFCLPTGEENVCMYVRPTLLPEATLSLEVTLLPGTCLAEPVQTGE
jgi:hypothetical protein